LIALLSFQRRRSVVVNTVITTPNVHVLRRIRGDLPQWPHVRRAESDLRPRAARELRTHDTLAALRPV
jgi:hypothetical protein